MGFIIGLIVVFFCVLGGYAIPGGHLKILFQPYEFLIIFGTAIGAFIIANPKFILKDTIKKLKLLFKRTPYNKDSYIALLSFLYVSFKSIKVKGIVEFEPHIEDPQNSKLFEPYSSITANHKVTNFFCDAMRLICIGVDNYHYIEEMMEKW